MLYDGTIPTVTAADRVFVALGYNGATQKFSPEVMSRLHALDGIENGDGKLGRDELQLAYNRDPVFKAEIDAILEADKALPIWKRALLIVPDFLFGSLAMYLWQAKAFRNPIMVWGVFALGLVAAGRAAWTMFTTDKPRDTMKRVVDALRVAPAKAA
jgi:hypothetical protein